MNENYDEDLEYQRAAEERRKRRQQRRRHERNMKIAFFAGIAVVILAAAFLIYYFVKLVPVTLNSLNWNALRDPDPGKPHRCFLWRSG